MVEMDLLLNPNVAYLLLVFGFTLAIMAIFAPGTGMLEIGALFTLLLAGYSVFNLPFNLWALLLLVLGGIAFFLAQRRTKQISFLVAFFLCFVIGSVFLFHGGKWWQPAVNPVLALLVSILVGIYFWIAFRKIVEARGERPTHDLSNLIGQTGQSKTLIDQEGSVQVSGELWSAYSKQKIPAGVAVRVVKREGFILEVEQIK
jgi:membrane-bound serine protease (ClpP class)